MKRSYLTALGLEKEQVDSIMSEHGNTVETLKEKHGEALEKAKEKLQAKIDKLQEAVDNASDDDGEDFKGKYEAEAKEHGKTQKALDDEKAAHEATKNSHETEKTTEAKKTAVLKQLIQDGANEKFAKVVAKAFDLEKVELDGDSIKNWDEISKPHKEEFADVFETADTNGVDTGKPPKAETKNLTLERVKAMSTAEINENWDEVQKVLEKG